MSTALQLGIPALVLASAAVLAVRPPHARDPLQAEGARSAAASTPAAPQKITTCLWFDGQAEEAARFYTSIFEGSKILGMTRWPEGGAGAAGSVLEVTFQIAGRELLALNGGPMFRFNEAVSLVVHCDTQAEIDSYWAKLGAGGKPSRCGWLQDKYGLSWQIVPTELGALMRDPDGAKVKRVMDALLQMDKIDVQALKRAHSGA